jgi:hypothetical protein
VHKISHYVAAATVWSADTRVSGREQLAFKRLLSGVAFVFFANTCNGGDLNPLDDRNAAENAMMTWSDVGAPVGHMLLIRHGTDKCVVRFTTFHRGHNAKPETSFNSGAESFSGEYDWFYAKTPSRRDQEPVYEVGHRTVSLRASAGVGRLSFQTADNEIVCGPLKLAWFYPVRVGFNGRDSARDIGIELAPTRWTTIEKVNFDDPALRWYKQDEARKPMLIPMDNLP